MNMSNEKKRANTTELSELVLQVGQKARRLLKEEIDKRKDKEIILLEESIDEIRRPVHSKKDKVDGAPSSSETDADFIDPLHSTVDRSRYHPVKQEEFSDIVQVHGLSHGSQLYHIQKFFSGLVVQRAFIIPPLHQRIEELDIDAKKDRKGVSPYLSETSNPRFVRIFVQFSSPCVADLAMKRSGETIEFQDPSRTKVSCRIVLSPVPRAIALFLDRFMAIDIHRDTVLQVLIQNIEDTDSLMRFVYNILWLALEEQTGVQVRIKNLEMDDLKIQTKPLKNLHPPKSKDEYLDLTTLHNTLWDMHSRIECSQMPFPLYDTDPRISIQGGYKRRMTLDAGIWLIEQMKAIQCCIHHVLKRNTIQ